MFKVFTADELTNEQYHEEKEHVSGSQLSTLFFRCPAALRYAPKKDAKHFQFGTTAHTNILEQSRFNKEYVRQPSQSEFSNLLTSDQAMKSWLKAHGVNGYSNKTTPELIAMIRSTGVAGVNIWAEIVNMIEAQASANNSIIVKAEDYDRVVMMRDVIMRNGSMREVVESGYPEISIFWELNGVPVKVRLDRVTADYCIVDYKTTRSAAAEDFGKHAYNLGYYLKMALQHDVFAAAYGRKPTAVKLLAQEKEEPFLAKMYRMTDWQLEIGRQQYQAALALYKRCVETDTWPNYGLSNQGEELHTPDFVKRKYKES